jgi:hypothetical protein
MRAITLAVMLALGGAASAESLGKIDFPTSGDKQAQERFLNGVMALHSFFYDEALEEFRAATRDAPGFAMGYWGEAMALNQTFWQGQDTKGGREALKKIPDGARLTEKERAWIGAVRVLYGEGDKRARDGAYAAAMEKLARAYPDDLEVQSFHALSLIGILRDDEPGLATRMRAGAIALDVLARNPEHPGAAHYIIHAFDDASHAIGATPGSRRRRTTRATCRRTSSSTSACGTRPRRRANRRGRRRWRGPSGASTASRSAITTASCGW